MNPALPGGALATDASSDEPAWAVSARAGYTFVPYGQLRQGRDEAPNPNMLAVDVHLATLQVIATAPSGTSLDVQLPAGSLVSSSLGVQRTDTGIGDLELRVRQTLSRWIGLPRVGLGASLGVVVPTGEYVARSGAANLAPEASYLTLGRGIPWSLVELDLRVPVATRWAVLAQGTGRLPLARTSDEFGWGSEVRGTVGVVFAATRRVSLLASTDLQWRDGATEPDPFSDLRLDSASAGGWQWTIAPSVAASVTTTLSLVAGVRVPVASDVTGNQLVPQTGAFVAVAYAQRRSARPTAPKILATPGTLTVVDYWATWCSPCTEISRLLDEAAPRWPEVRIVKVDATNWPGADVPVLPEGARGLPAIEILDGNGARVSLLVGEDALRVIEKIDALRAANARTMTRP